MASMDDDDSFRVRVTKIFGSLAPSSKSNSTSSSPAPWSLTDDAVERRQWRRGRDGDTSSRDETPCSSSFDEYLKKNRAPRNLPDDDEEGDCRDRDSIRDEWEIRSSIGLDNTLDNEEEEDEFDKVAVGRENAGERLYMNDVTGRGSYLNMHNVIPDSLHDAAKDPRASQYMTKIRLNEDDAEAQNLNIPHSECDTGVNKSHAKVFKDDGQPKSILKRKDSSGDSKPRKRVRFDPGCINDSDESSEKVNHSWVGASSMDATDSDDGSELAQKSKVPDYILNPSKYTRYSFDSSDEYIEESSIKACMDVLRLVKSPKSEEVVPDADNASGDLPKSVTFIPKKKAVDIKAVNMSGVIKENKEDDDKQSLPLAGFRVGIAAVESKRCEVNADEEMEPETNAINADEEMAPETNATNNGARFQKPGRKYRTPTRSDECDS